jgi:hypothetical protein
MHELSIYHSSTLTEMIKQLENGWQVRRIFPKKTMKMNEKTPCFNGALAQNDP